MKIKINVKEMFNILGQYEKELKELVEKYNEILENNQFKIEKIKDKEIRNIFEIQLGTKEDFNFKVILENNKWVIKEYNAKSILPIILRNEYIILDWDEKEVQDIEITEYLYKKYKVKAEIYKGVNYVGEGKINWEKITEDIKNNWNNSFFFLEKMNNDNFVKNNKELILDKVKNDNKLLREAIMKSSEFFNYALKEIEPEKLLEVARDNENYLEMVWNKRVKKIMLNSDEKILLKKEQDLINKELKIYLNMLENGFLKYAETDNELKEYKKLEKRLLDSIIPKEEEIKKEVKENKKTIKEVMEILNDKKIKTNLIKGLLKGEINKEDFKLFENDIIQNPELKEIIIKNGLKDPLLLSKEFIKSLSSKELLQLLKVFSKTEDLYYTILSSHKEHINKIVGEEQLLKMFHIEKVEEERLYILEGYKTENKELKKHIFRTNPKEYFVNLKKEEIKYEDIELFIKEGGYITQLKSKINIYEIKNINTIKILCGNYKEVLNNRKTPEEWKVNPKIIYAVIESNKSLSNTGLTKENILKLSEDIDFVKKIVSLDKSNIFYKNLPERLKNKKEIAECLLNTDGNIEEIIEVLPSFMLADKKFNIEIIKNNPAAIKYLNKNIWEDKEFTLTLFNEFEKTNKEKELGKNLPDKIKLFLDTFNIENKYYTFFNNYYLRKKLEEDLKNEKPEDKIRKNKI